MSLVCTGHGAERVNIYLIVCPLMDINMENRHEYWANQIVTAQYLHSRRLETYTDITGIYFLIVSILNRTKLSRVY